MLVKITGRKKTKLGYKGKIPVVLRSGKRTFKRKMSIEIISILGKDNKLTNLGKILKGNERLISIN